MHAGLRSADDHPPGGVAAGEASPPASRRALVAAARAVGVRERRVLDAVRDVPRSAYVPARRAGGAAVDQPIPIGHRQSASQPSLVALMVEALALTGEGTALEVGTGFGYQTALLARVAREVWSVERIPELAHAARANLRAQGVENAHVVVGDGSEGLPEHAPYEGIVLSAAFPEVPPPLVDQLAPGGRLVQPIGPSGDEDVVLFVRDPEGLRRVRTLVGAYFVPLVGLHGYRAR